MIGSFIQRFKGFFHCLLGTVRGRRLAQGECLFFKTLVFKGCAWVWAFVILMDKFIQYEGDLGGQTDSSTKHNPGYPLQPRSQHFFETPEGFRPKS